MDLTWSMANILLHARGLACRKWIGVLLILVRLRYTRLFGTVVLCACYNTHPLIEVLLDRPEPGAYCGVARGCPRAVSTTRRDIAGGLYIRTGALALPG